MGSIRSSIIPLLLATLAALAAAANGAHAATPPAHVMRPAPLTATAHRVR